MTDEERQLEDDGRDAARGRVALVTGANRGIGFEIARQLGTLGMRVILTARDSERGALACQRLESEGLEASFETLDVSDLSSIEQAIARVDERFGRLDVLINNAAVSLAPEARLLEVDFEVITTTFATNLWGPLHLVRAVVPSMSRHGYGRIVNVSSGQGSFGKLQSGRAAYRISKTALNAMTVVLADELRDTNILVNAMTPGWCKTRLVGFKAPRTTAEGADTAVWLATLPDSGPRGRFFKDRKDFPW